jgi:hypothetical protein
MTEVFELLVLGLYFWLGRKMFGERFYHQRELIPWWQRAIAGFLSLVLVLSAGLLVWSVWERI